MRRKSRKPTWKKPWKRSKKSKLEGHLELKKAAILAAFLFVPETQPAIWIVQNGASSKALEPILYSPYRHD
jgi:hypothetical protein